MSKYISELMSPQLMGVVYAFVGFIIALYVLSVVYVFIDARRRGASAYVAWGIIALIPFVGLIAYLLLAPALLCVRPRGAGAGHGSARAPACPVRHLPAVRRANRERLRRLPGVRYPGSQRMPQLPSPARCALEGLPLLPNSHPVTHPSLGRPQATGTPQAMRAPHPAPTR
jgi:hypothetical protein